MRRNHRDFDDEILGHLALETQERIERGEDPNAARLGALRQFGYIPQVRDEMRRVWFSRWLDALDAVRQDLRVALRSLLRTRGMSATVIATLALGIGANAAIFSVVRGVLLRPLINRGEERLVYVQHSAPGLGGESVAFSVPEIKDVRERATTVEAFGEFSTIEFTLVGLGEPRVVRAGVVDGQYFDVVGLRPTIGRLIEPSDEGAHAAPVVVLTHRFWAQSLNSDPSLVGKAIQLGRVNATIVGVLEPSVPYPADTELVANVAASPHHLDAQMVTMRSHRMTQLFGRLKIGATIDDARSELSAIHDDLKSDYPESYPHRAAMRIEVTALREQISAPARPILLLLFAAAAIVFIIACSNVANLILARSIRREAELAVRAALGASRGALRRTLLAESLVLCGAGAVLGVLLARPLVGLVAGFASRFSVRAAEVVVDSSLLWVGALLSMAAAVTLAYVPRLPLSPRPRNRRLATDGLRLTSGNDRRLKVFATIQVAFTFVLLVGAATLVARLVALRSINTGYDMRQVLVLDVPRRTLEVSNPEEVALYDQIIQRVAALRGVEGVSMGSVTPWRDAGRFGAPAGVTFTGDGYRGPQGDEDPRARLRIVAPNFFHVVGIPLLAGRDFTGEDRRDSEPVVIVSHSVAQLLHPHGNALGRHMWWTDRYFGPKPLPRRIVGIVADVDDEHIARGSVRTVYHPMRQVGVSDRLFVRTAGDPHLLAPAISDFVRELAADQPAERAATLDDIRAEVTAPERINAFVLAGFAGVALVVAVVGVAGVLAFGVSLRTREFALRLAVGSAPSALLTRVLSEGIVIVAVGIAAGAASGYLFATVAAAYFGGVTAPGVGSMLGAAGILAGAALAATLMPAAKAARVDVLQALRSE